MATSDNDDDGSQPEYYREVTYLDSTLDLDSETTCTICHAEFLDAEDLKMHMEQVHSSVNTNTDPPVPEVQGSKICQFCDFSYSCLDAYARHIAKKHLKSLFCCEFCSKCFKEENKLKKHENRHKFKSVFACTQCTSVFSTKPEVAAHEFVYHDNKNDGEFIPCLPQLSSYLNLNALKYLQSRDHILVCHSCSFTKSTTAADIKAYLKHLDEDKCEAYVCDVCCYVSKDKRTLRNHFQRKFACKHPKEIVNNSTICSKCSKSITCKEMGAHIEICTNYNCYNCNIKFLTIAELSAHQSAVHPVELGLIKCRFCPKEYVGNIALDKHTKRSHGKQFHLYKYTCKSCDGIFKHPQELFVHYFSKHKDLQPYTCKICNQTFRVRKRFTIHIKLEHKGAGVVEFDENYHVFFASQRSENPFVPKCVIPELVAAFRSEKDKNKNDKAAMNDDMTTEIDTEAEGKIEKPKPKQKAKSKRRRGEVLALSSSDEEETENLLTLKKRAERKRFQKHFVSGSNRIIAKRHRKHITCIVCNKYCYTVQNYQNHIKTHKKDKSFDCIKCSKSFKTKNELTNHMNKNHGTSKLIETLKTVLERKQTETNPNNDDTIAPDDYASFENLSMTERFMKTVKKVKLDKQGAMAKISPSTGPTSVKNFLESFDPNPTESPIHSKTVEAAPVVTMKEYDSPFYRKRTIKLTRFVPEPPSKEIKLRMPQKFKSSPFYDNQNIKLNVKIVNEPFKHSSFIAYETNFQNNDHNYEAFEDMHDHNDYDDRNDTIPEVAQEVMLEGTDEPPRGDNPEYILPNNPEFPHKIVLPKLPAGYKKIHIATLQPQAPYYKIITVKNEDTGNDAIVIDPKNIKTETKPSEPKPNIRIRKDIISLPDGTKFVSANPLAHLLGDRPVEELLQPVKNKYYNPPPKNIKGLLADALQNLENGNHRVRKRKAEQAPAEPKTCRTKSRGPPKAKLPKPTAKRTVPEKTTRKSAPEKSGIEKSPETSILSPKKATPEKLKPEQSMLENVTSEDAILEISGQEEEVTDSDAAGKSLPLL